MAVAYSDGHVEQQPRRCVVGHSSQLAQQHAKARATALTAEAIAALDRFGDRAALLAEAARFIVERKN